MRRKKLKKRQNILIKSDNTKKAGNFGRVLICLILDDLPFSLANAKLCTKIS